VKTSLSDSIQYQQILIANPTVLVFALTLSPFYDKLKTGLPLLIEHNIKKAASCRSQLLAYRRFTCIQTMQTARLFLRNFL
jgi:type III secretory pathway component EscU